MKVPENNVKDVQIENNEKDESEAKVQNDAMGKRNGLEALGNKVSQT